MIVAGQILADRFELQRRIGSGGMGEVFAALDRAQGEMVAVKTLARANGDTLSRFKREFRALQMTAHPNLVSLRELIRDGEHWFFTMELVEGQHFLEYVRGRGIPDYHRLRSALRQLISGLLALHAGGLVHRDIKPSNVMITSEGRVVILDFGLVTHMDPAGQSSATGPVGTVEYMAPEQAVGRVVGEAADWYSVGVMLYEALAGNVPHGGHALQILIDKQQVEPPPVDELAPAAPADLRALCNRLLRIEPGARPSAEQVARHVGLDPAEARAPSSVSVVAATGVFVGRERELADLARAAEHAREVPVVHLVAGESGIGKSELVARFIGELTEADADALALAGRCYERESVPYKALDGVADGLAQQLSSMPAAEVQALLPPRPSLLLRLFPVFQRIEPIASAPVVGRDEVSEPLEQRRRMFAALRHLLACLARSRRVVITIDDLQWADADSFLLLRGLLAGPDAPPVLVLATVRGDQQQADAVAVQLDGLPVQRTHLGPLNDAEIRVLAEKLVPHAERLDLQRIAREAGGHPMFLQEILRHLGAGAAGEPSATLDDALWSRVGVLHGDARAVLEMVCIAGAPISIEVTGLACQLDGTAVARAAAALRVGSLAREVQRGRLLAIEPYHDRVREAVGRRLDADRRRGLHARLAGALEVGGETRDAQLLLRNFILAGMPQRAARYAEEAAERSEAAHAFDQAAGLWSTALEVIARDPEDRRRLQLRLGQALINAGRGAEAAEHFLAAAVDADRPTSLECQCHAAEQLIISGRLEPGMAALDALLAEIGVSTPRSRKGTLLSLLRHRLWLRLRGLGFGERTRREIADSELLQLDVLKVAAHSLALVDSVRGMDFQTRQLLLALRTGYRPAIARALLLESMFHSTGGNPKRAQVLLERALAVGADDQDPYMRAMIQGAHGMKAYFGGDVVASVDHLEQSEIALRDVPGHNWEFATARLFQLFSLRYVGDFVTMRRKYDQYGVEAAHRGDRYLDSTMRRASVLMWLANDDPARARAELDRATWVPQAVGFHVQHFHEMVALGEIAIYTGELGDPARFGDMFARLDRSMLRRVESIRVADDYIRGRLALCGYGSPDQALRAARRLAKGTNRLGQAWTLLLRAGAEAIDGRREQSAARMEEAVAAADAAGMRLTAAAARRRLAELRDQTDGVELIAATDEMGALGVRAPGRMTDLLIPVARLWR